MTNHLSQVRQKKIFTGNRYLGQWRNLVLIAVLLSVIHFFFQMYPLVRDWEDRFQSVHYVTRSHFTEPKIFSIPVVVILIDDASLPEGERRSPLNRKWLASLLDEVSEHQPSLIGLNILLDRAGEKDGDQLLAEAIKNAGNVILRDDPVYPVLPVFSTPAVDQGTIRFHVDSSGTVQRICNAITSCQTKDIFHKKFWRHFKNSYDKHNLSIPNIPWLKINFFLNWGDSPSSFSQFPIIRAHEVFQLSDYALQGKLILIGTGFPDLYPTYRVPVSGPEQFLQETELIAQTLGMIAEGRYLNKPPALIISIVFLAILCLLAWSLVFKGPLHGAWFTIILLVVYFFFSNFMFVLWNWEIPFVLPATLLIIFLIIAGLSQWIQEKFVRLETELQLKQTKIDFLTNELHSHHLFNEFSRVSVMIRKDPETAREYLVEFAEMLRASLKYSDQPWVPLQKQIDYLKSYIRQQQLIHGERLKFNMDFEINIENASIPWHVFFPIVENAVKYTESLISSVHVEPQIQIQLTCSKSFLIFTVVNSFDKDNRPPSTRTGLKNLMERLKLLYPNGGYHLELTPEKKTWKTQLHLPFP